MRTVTARGPGFSLSTRAEHTHLITTLRGELDIASAPALRDQLLDLLHPATSRLILDLSAVSYADASGLAVCDDYVAPFPFTGAILGEVTVEVDGPAFIDPEGEAEIAIVTQ